MIVIMIFMIIIIVVIIQILILILLISAVYETPAANNRTTKQSCARDEKKEIQLLAGWQSDQYSLEQLSSNDGVHVITNKEHVIHASRIHSPSLNTKLRLLIYWLQSLEDLGHKEF